MRQILLRLMGYSWCTAMTHYKVFEQSDAEYTRSNETFSTSLTVIQQSSTSGENGSNLKRHFFAYVPRSPSSESSESSSLQDWASRSLSDYNQLNDECGAWPVGTRISEISNILEVSTRII